MKRAALALALLELACGAEEADLQGIRTRVSVDRSETRVGDPFGVTIEVETPPEFGLEAPAPPGSSQFFTDAVELLDPLRIPGGLRHHLLWTVRAREVGDALLPALELGIVRPGGEIQRMTVGGMPLAVRSVRDELPERAVFFDIRPAPEPELLPPWIWAAATGLGVFALISGLALWARHASRNVETGPSSADLARLACAEIEDALAEPETRVIADRVQAAVMGFVGQHWTLPIEAATPADLPTTVDVELAGLLRALERERFAKSPARDALLSAAQQARDRMRHVALA